MLKHLPFQNFIGFSLLNKKIIMKKTLLLILTLTSTFYLKGQDPNPPRAVYFFLGIGLSIIKVRDEAHSSLKYQGFMPTLRIGYEEITEKHVSRIAVSASFGTAAPKTKPKPQQNISNLEVNNIQVNYTYYQRSGAFDTEGWNRYLGGAFTMTIDMRSYNLPSNNLLGYQVNASLNIGAFIQKKLDAKWRFNYEAFTPILSYALRPSYMGMIPMKGGDFNAKSVFTNGKIVTINKLFRFYNRFSFDQTINDHRQRRLNYAWDFHSNTVSKPLKSIVTGLGYESLFKM